MTYVNNDTNEIDMKEKHIHKYTKKDDRTTGFVNQHGETAGEEYEEYDGVACEQFDRLMYSDL